MLNIDGFTIVLALGNLRYFSFVYTNVLDIFFGTFERVLKILCAF